MPSCSAANQESRAPITAATSCSPAPASRSPGRWATWARYGPTTHGSPSSPQRMERTLQLAAAPGATVQFPAMAIDDLGVQAVIADPAGAVTGIWQPGTFPGFTVVHEHGTPSFVAIDVHDYHGEVAFYRQVFGWDPVEEEADGHHYAGYMDRDNNRPIAGIGDEVESLAPGEPPHWSVFWQSDDVDASVAKVRAHGGAVLTEAADHGLGRVALVADRSGAPFWLFRPKR